MSKSRLNRRTLRCGCVMQRWPRLTLEWCAEHEIYSVENFADFVEVERPAAEFDLDDFADCPPVFYDCDEARVDMSRDDWRADVRAAIIQAWSEGYVASFLDDTREPGEPQHLNPYRTDRAEA